MVDIKKSPTIDDVLTSEHHFYQGGIRIRTEASHDSVASNESLIDTKFIK